MGTDVKTLEILWWLQLSKRQILTFLLRLIMRDREIGGSNPFAPTNQIRNLPLAAMAAVFHLWPICARFFNQSNLSRESMGPDIICT
jgi:hypothetical protein